VKKPQYAGKEPSNHGMKMIRCSMLRDPAFTHNTAAEERAFTNTVLFVNKQYLCFLALRARWPECCAVRRHAKGQRAAVDVADVVVVVVAAAAAGCWPF
jgi:hypothetical protein